ncbi:MAG: LysM domain-containing protein [Defluviitaleaceae bacterium]|nr:LysM domain-containing protein [Defluviitaleaceae bacterium]
MVKALAAKNSARISSNVRSYKKTSYNGSNKRGTSKNSRQNKKRKPKNFFNIFIAFTLYASIASIIYFIFFSPNAYAVYIGENRVVLMQRGVVTEDLFLLNLLARISIQNENSPVVLREDVSLAPVRASSGVLSLEQALNIAVASSSYYIKAATFIIDSEPIVTVSSEDEASRIIKYIASKTASGVPINIETPNANIVIENRFPGPAGGISSFETAVSKLTQFRVSLETHTISQGETLSSIALLANSTVEEILSLNQGLNANSLTVGEVINVGVYRPILTVLYEDYKEPPKASLIYELEEIEQYYDIDS